MEGSDIWTLPGSKEPMLGFAQPDLSTGNWHAGRGALDIFSMQGGSFKLMQSVSGEFRKVHAFNDGGSAYLAACKAPHKTGHTWVVERDSLVLKWSGSSYQPLLTIPTKDCRDLLPFNIGQQVYVLAVNYQDNSKNYLQDAVLYRFSNDTVAEIQRIPSEKAHSAAVVSGAGHTILALGSLAGNMVRVFAWNGTGFSLHEQLHDDCTKKYPYWLQGYTINGHLHLGIGGYGGTHTGGARQCVSVWQLGANASTA